MNEVSHRGSRAKTEFIVSSLLDELTDSAGMIQFGEAREDLRIIPLFGHIYTVRKFLSIQGSAFLQRARRGAPNTRPSAAPDSLPPIAS